MNWQRMMLPNDIYGPRFWARVNIVRDETSCWLWTGARHHGKSRLSYGEFTAPVDGRTKHVYAHRLSYAWFNGPLVKGRVVCHYCDVVLCVRPSHLFQGTQGENAKDMWEKKRGSPPPMKMVVTWEQVKEIRSRFAAGEDRGSLLRAYPLSRTGLNAILREENWRSEDWEGANRNYRLQGHSVHRARG